ncbi:MAG: YggS family pyridoxal phosphate enzyme, partial [Nitrospiraceae bacterium]
MTDSQLIENISRIYRRISEAAVRAGRKAEDIKLIAVTKTVGLQQIQEAAGAG